MLAIPGFGFPLFADPIGPGLSSRRGTLRAERVDMGSEATKGKGAVTGGDVVVYEEKGGRVRLEVRLEGETVWLSLSQMAELFGRDKSVISKHLRGVFATGELSRAATVAENATVQREGGRDGHSPDRVLQPRCRPLGRLSGELEAWHPVPHLGDRQAARAPPARVHAQRAAPAREGPRGDGAGRGPARAHAEAARAGHGRGAGRPRGRRAVRALLAAAAWSTTSDGWQRRPFTRASRRARWHSRAHAAPLGASGGPWPPTEVRTVCSARSAAISLAPSSSSNRTRAVVVMIARRGRGTDGPPAGLSGLSFGPPRDSGANRTWPVQSPGTLRAERVNAYGDHGGGDSRS